MKIICDGDSWVYGCEIVNPILVEKYGKDVYAGSYDFFEENDSYRLPKTFSTHLGRLFNADVINLSWPADDNNTILNRVITFISKEYLNKNIPTDDLFVIIGWSSPERNSFWYKDEKISMRFRLWPQVPHFDSREQEEFWKIYVSTLWNPEEYIPRYVMNVLQFQNFCEVNNIKWLCFNSFYQTPNENINNWKDLNVLNELQQLHLQSAPYHYNGNIERKIHDYEYVSTWNLIDNNRFYKKNSPNNTFKSFIENKNQQPIFNGWHPSPESHKLWAEELYNYINENNLNDYGKNSNMRRLI